MSARTKFTPLRDALSAGDGACFLGVLVEKRGPTLSADRWLLELTIQDHIPSASGAGSKLTTRIRRQKQQDLPAGGNCGDIVILRHMKMEVYQQKPNAVSTRELQSEVIFFPVGSIPTPFFIHPYAPGGLSKLQITGMYVNCPTPEEQADVIHFKEAMASVIADIQQKSLKTTQIPTTLPRRPPAQSKMARRLCEIKDMGYGEFHDLFAEVVKTYYVNSESLDIYVTDYTTNENLYLYEDDNDDADDLYSFSKPKTWKGPMGQMTMAIRLWEPHASFARENVHEGDIVFLRNIRCKMSKAGKLEGAISVDYKFPDKVCVHMCTDPQKLATIEERRDAYDKSHNRQKGGGDNVENLPKKASAKSSAKREEKRKRKQLQKELEREELEKKAEELELAKAGINAHVRAGHVGKKLCKIAEIINNPRRTTKTETGDLELPFINCKYRVRVRVVDYWPPKLQDFARSVIDPKYGNLNLSSEQRERYEDKFEWNFALLVEDAEAPAGKTPERLMLTIGDMQGQGLLKLDACNLMRNPAKCSQLEEKLFIIWGNLSERKTALTSDGVRLPLPTGDEQLQLQNTPFDCCIEEFGEPLGDQGDPKSWRRRFSIFDTTIMG